MADLSDTDDIVLSDEQEDDDKDTDNVDVEEEDIKQSVQALIQGAASKAKEIEKDASSMSASASTTKRPQTDPSGTASKTKTAEPSTTASKSQRPTTHPSLASSKARTELSTSAIGETMVDNATSTHDTKMPGDDDDDDLKEKGDDGGEEEDGEEDEDEDDDDEEEYDEEGVCRGEVQVELDEIAHQIEEQKKKRKSFQGVSDYIEVDFETLIREEFKRLHRQYRLMEDARHAIAGASGKLSKQGQLLEQLRYEKEDLQTDLKNATCKAYTARDKQSINTILEALERYEKYKADIAACLLSIDEMEQNVDRITQRLVEQRLKVQSIYGHSLTVPQAEHKRRALEDKLFYMTNQTDTLVTQNKQLKQEINMMLKLRGSFYRRMLHIKRASAKIKHRMGEVVFEATAAYDQRDDWINKINILRERNDKDSKQHVLEIKEFQRVLHHDSKIHEFLAIKNKERDLLENTAQRLDRKNRGKINELEQLLIQYKKSFKAILALAKSRDIDSLVNTYLEDEHKNYAMFKYITDLNHEANWLQEDIRKIKEEIEQLSRASKDLVKSQEKTLADYDKELEEATKKLDSSLKDWNQADKHLEEFGNLLDEAFTIAGCSNTTIVALLGNQNGMGPHNICLCMKALEHRVTELLFERGMLEVRKSVEIDGNPVPKKPQLWTQGQKPPPQGGPYKPVVHVTGRVDSEQEEEDSEVKAWSERPIYYEEMKNIIKQSMQTMQIAEDHDHHSGGDQSMHDLDTTSPSTTKQPQPAPTTTEAPAEGSGGGSSQAGDDEDEDGEEE